MRPLLFSELQPEVVSEARLDPAPLLANTVFTYYNGRLLVSTFRGSGTFTKNLSTSHIIVFAWNGGCGGGGGSVGLPNGNRNGFGGGGGAGGNALCFTTTASYFASNVTITIGAGGAGGAPQSATFSNGNPGGIGGQTSVGGLAIPTRAGGVGQGGGSATPLGSGISALGGTQGQSSYVMSGGYVLADGTQMGGQGCGTVLGATYPANVSDSITGTGTFQMPVLPFMVTTGGGGAIPFDLGNLPGAYDGGDIILFGNTISYGGQGGGGATISGTGVGPFAGVGTFLAWPYQASMFVTGGTGGGGGGSVYQQTGGFGGVGAGGGGSTGTTPSSPPSSAGGPGGPGLVIIYEFI